ncbi:MAG: hypothetical protein ACE5IG_04565 [Dehalococcoidia bacterium]
MSVSDFLLAEGVEMELPAELDEMLGILEAEVQTFALDDYRYRLSPLRGVVGSEWRLLINLTGGDALGPEGAPIGFLALEQRQEGGTSLRIPPRPELEHENMAQADPEGTFYSSFIFQLLNAFQQRGYLDLPGTLPIR